MVMTCISQAPIVSSMRDLRSHHKRGPCVLFSSVAVRFRVISVVFASP